MTSLDAVVTGLVSDAIERAVAEHTQGIRLLDDEQVAERLSLHPKTVARMRQRGELPSVVVGEKSRRVRSDVLEDYIKSLSGGRPDLSVAS